MKPKLNQWSPPAVAKLWPEGSQIVWRHKLDSPSYEKHHLYGENGWFRPDKIGVEYPWTKPGVQFMLLELPIVRRK